MYEAPPYWKAPELLKNAPHTMATDVYAFGMLLYEVLFRRDPFAGESSEVRQRMYILRMGTTYEAFMRTTH